MRAIGRLLSFVQSHRQESLEKPSTTEGRKPTPSACLLNRAKVLIIQNVQREAYEQEISCLNNSDGLQKTSPLLKLNPIVDNDGLVRVGGRLRRASLSNEDSHPLIVPSSHHVSSLLIKHYHEKVQHQGRHFTLGLIRSIRFWRVGSKRAVNSAINNHIKDGAYYCYCAYVLRISRYSDFLSPMLTNTGIFLRGLKLSGESRS